MLSVVAAGALIGADCNPFTAPSHEPIAGALIVGYGQGRINGVSIFDLLSAQPVSGQVGGTLCLFEGAQYSYTAKYAYWNQAMKGDKPDRETFYGTYTEPGPGTIEFTGRLAGIALVEGKTLTLGNNLFGEGESPDLPCESLR